MSPSAIAARTNRCANDHEFTPENTIREASGDRRCRTCKNTATRDRYHASKEAA